MDVTRSPLQSPCTGICKLNPQNICEGCFRTVDEIARWGSSSPAEQHEMIAKCEARRQTLIEAASTSKSDLISIA
ncbi:MAG: DUF1289 domain-containing protein [Planctomycetota bacterium]|nr:DUF1289 domain-containing protein [Planctomycetota bacterium]